MQKIIIIIFQCFTCSNIAIDALMRSEQVNWSWEKIIIYRKTKNSIDRSSKTEYVN